MRDRTKRMRNFIIVSLMFLLTAWFAVPRSFRRLIQPTAFAAAKTFTVNVTGDGADANPGDGVCATASGNCSLRAAIQESNAIAGTDNIYFDIPGTGVKTISPGSSLPDITSAVYIDGYTQTGASQNTLQNGDNAVLTIELNGLNSGVAYGLKIVAGGCTVRGLVIRTFSEGQISLTTNGGNAIEGNFIGTNAAGTAQGFCNGVPGAATDGIDIFTGNNTIGGTTAAVRNIISGNCGSGIEIVSGNRNNILGNFIGTDASGTLPLGNLQSGVLIAAGATNNVVGGAPDATRNIISGNGQRGIEITGTGTSGNQVQNNFIGVDVSGTAAVGNLQSGVLINSGASNNTIGGAWPDGAAAVGNVIAFNNDRGVRVAGSNSTGNAILTNSIFSNGNIGIDLGNDGVTPNNSLGHIGPNNYQNFPIVNAAGTSGTASDMHVVLDSTPNTSFTIQVFANATCDPSGYGQGQHLIGQSKQTTDGNGRSIFEFFYFTSSNRGQFITATATDPNNNTSEFSPCAQVTATPLTIQFSAPSYTGAEVSPTVDVTITRSGDTSGAASVSFTTGDTAGALNCNVANGVASSRCDYETRISTVRFAPGETVKTVSVIIIDDSYLEGPESFTVTLSNPSGAALGSQSSATISLIDNDNANGANPIDPPRFFVRQHYYDFLNRVPDASGLDFWTNQFHSCGDSQCLGIRVNVSAAFYLSIEFQQTGYLVERVYKAAYGDGVGTSTLGGSHQLAVPVVRLDEFLPDTQEIGEGVVVGQGNWQQQLETNKQNFTAEFVQRARFTTAFPVSITAAQFVDKLNTNAGGPLSQSERDQLVSDLSTSAKTRAQVLRAITEHQNLVSAESNRAFVLMQFFGYLRRNPNDPPDTNYTGYDFWLTKLNQFNGNFQSAEMVKAFITSIEYRQRFGP